MKSLRNSGSRLGFLTFGVLSGWGCSPSEEDSGPETDTDVLESQDTGDTATIGTDTGDTDTGDTDTGSEACEPPDYGEPGDPFADAVVDFVPGEGAGFGEESLPDIVLGPPLGKGPDAGSEDVLTLGAGGQIILEFTDRELVDGEGVDLLVFENPFPGWVEPGIVGVSQDGKTWSEWTCDPESYASCAGVEAVLSHPDNCIDATVPEEAGGDGFDLAELGMVRARFVRIRDAGTSGPGGFDLDAIAIVHGQALER
jgi:hypothetical protein